MSRPYFQFPLCSLRFGTSRRQRLEAIISYGCVEMGKRLWTKHTVEERESRRAHPPDWCRRTLRKDTHLEAVFGCEHLNVSAPNLEAMIAEHSDLARFVKIWEQQHGPDALVRIRTDWLFEVRDYKGMSYPELAVLAAIYSKIGAARGPVRILQDEIWKRTHGCKSDRVFRAEMNRRRRPFLTPRQVRSIIERLHGRHFFARVTVGRRQTSYSNRLSNKELADCVFTAKIQRSLARQERIRTDADLTKRIQAARRKLAGSDATEGATDAPL